MGYPMTVQRVLNRNALSKGGYGHTPEDLMPSQWAVSLNLDNPGLSTMEELIASQWPRAVQRLRNYEGQVRLLLGDLRRLEADTVDEKITCQAIAHKTGIDPEVIAIVLKEFLAW